MKKLIIIEGNDNSGKDTLIDGLVNHFNESSIEIFHCNAPKSKDSDEAAIEQWNNFMELIDNIYKSEKDIVICNRAWYGEYVYGVIYRNRSKESVASDIRKFEETMKLWEDNIQMYYIQLIADSQVLHNNDDGKSLSKNDIDKIELERNNFLEIFGKSKANKLMIKVTKNGKYRTKKSILNKTINFVSK